MTQTNNWQKILKRSFKIDCHLTIDVNWFCEHSRNWRQPVPIELSAPKPSVLETLDPNCDGNNPELLKRNNDTPHWTKGFVNIVDLWIEKSFDWVKTILKKVTFWSGRNDENWNLTIRQHRFHHCTRIVVVWFYRLLNNALIY